MKMEFNPVFMQKSLIAMMAMVVLFTACGDNGGDSPAPTPTPDPDPDPETEIVLPGMKVSVMEEYLNEDATNTDTDWHLYADVMKLKVEFTAPTGENQQAAKVDAPVLTFTAGEEEVTYTLSKDGEAYVTDEIRDEFADAYRTGFDMVITAKVNDEEYEGTATEVVEDITVTTGKFGSVVFGTFGEYTDNYRYKTVQICDEDGENCQVWLAEDLKTETDETDGRTYGNTDNLTKEEYVAIFGHHYSVQEMEAINEELHKIGWAVPTADELKKMVSIFGTFDETTNSFTDVESYMQDIDHWEYDGYSATNLSGFTLRGGGYDERKNGTMHRFKDLFAGHLDSINDTSFNCFGCGKGGLEVLSIYGYTLSIRLIKK
ncbi:FISUMP domain-containing protein [Persicobacter diffluens]|uniref:Uncharacterized protein n=1 Tax=Persicobacter diffluens TaxID=981 RepID=A0AAN4W3H2_9BACT|nr:hypothetical protein PEDI_38570 [Persicobacter diffluens]